MRILTLNAGSSSLKFSLFESDGEQTIVRGAADWARSPTRYTFSPAGSASRSHEVEWSDFTSAVAQVAADLASTNSTDRISAVAHRVVHGGSRFTEPVLLTDEIMATLRDLTSLAPLHNPSALEVIDASRQVFPQVAQVAAFDTAFHATLPPQAFVYPVPHAWTERWGLRRYGFHGLSHAYCAVRAGELLQRPSGHSRLVVAHLGHGASLAAIRDGECVDTTMGFTPLEGLMMATRSGSIDPGLLLHVQRVGGLSNDEMDRILNHESGLLGVSGVSADMREVHGAGASGNARARLAIDIYVHRLRQGIAAMAAALGGMDALVFTGGVGEHDSTIREAACDGLAFLGVQFDRDRNRQVRPDAVVSALHSPVSVLVIETKEDLMLCRAALSVLGNAA